MKQHNQHEPSLEDVLASIRAIIAEAERGPSAEAEADAAVARGIHRVRAAAAALALGNIIFLEDRRR